MCEVPGKKMHAKNVHSRAYNKERVRQTKAGVDAERAKELARIAGNAAVEDARARGILDESVDVN